MVPRRGARLRFYHQPWSFASLGGAFLHGPGWRSLYTNLTHFSRRLDILALPRAVVKILASHDLEVMRF
jgi:hypothetical protein